LKVCMVSTFRDSADLRAAVSHQMEETKGHVTRLKQVFQLHNEDAKAVTCERMKGIFSEGEEILDHDENISVRECRHHRGLSEDGTL
jgi:ferritin-like metal-binding protein YciE